MLKIFAFLSLLILALPAQAEVQITRSNHYGPDDRQIVDVYQSDICKSHTCPVVMWVHGGGWKHGDTSGTQSTAMQSKWAEQGIVMVGVNYRLAPQVVHPAEAQDIAAAINWVHSNISKFGGDPTRISLLGHSAGAHLVALLGTNPTYLAAYNLSPSGTLANVFPIDTASFDLTKPSRFVKHMVDEAFGEDEAVLREASPIWNVHKGGSYPPFIMAATKVRADAVETSTILQEKLREAGGSAELMIADYPGARQLKAHGLIAKDLANLDCEMTRALIGRVLNRR